MKLLFHFFILSLTALQLGAGCRDIPAQPTMVPLPKATSTNGLTLILETESLSIWANESDDQTVRDIHAAILANSKQVCENLQTACHFPVVIEVYPDQSSFDEHIINPDMRGFFAISGYPHTIQMVSPANPGPHKISYEEGVSVAIHEFTHLALNEVNSNLPTWLEEGTAVYVGPHDLYLDVCQSAFPFELTPSFQQLEADYNQVQAADLFAYAVVDFIVRQYGMNKLNQLLRSPDELENILEVSRETFEDNWQQFIQTQYHNN